MAFRRITPRQTECDLESDRLTTWSNGMLAYCLDTDKLYRLTNGVWKLINSTGGGAAWGSITGTLSAQTDLQNALNAKQASGTYASGTGSASGTNTGDNATNSQYSGLAGSKQDNLVNQTNIKSVNGSTLLGSGDLVVSASDQDISPTSSRTIATGKTVVIGSKYKITGVLNLTIQGNSILRIV